MFANRISSALPRAARHRGHGLGRPARRAARNAARPHRAGGRRAGRPHGIRSSAARIPGSRQPLRPGPRARRRPRAGTAERRRRPRDGRRAHPQHAPGRPRRTLPITMAVGPVAARAAIERPGQDPLVLAMLSRLDYESLKASPALRRTDRHVGVLLREPAMADQLALIDAVLPQKRRLGVVATAESEPIVRELQRAAQGLGPAGRIRAGREVAGLRAARAGAAQRCAHGAARPDRRQPGRHARGAARGRRRRPAGVRRQRRPGALGRPGRRRLHARPARAAGARAGPEGGRRPARRGRAGRSGDAGHRARQQHRGARAGPAPSRRTRTDRAGRPPPDDRPEPRPGRARLRRTTDGPARARTAARLVVGGSLQRDLFRLGVVPCAAVALALTAWFTHSRLDTLEAAFNAEGQAVARQVAAMSDLSLYAGDLPALQNVANAALRGGQVTRVEISNSAGVYVTAGPKTAPLAQLRMFTAPVTLREASRASAFAPEGSTAAGETPIGLVQAFRDTTAYARERTRSLMAGIGIAMIALLAAWAWVRHTARAVAQPLRRISRTVAALEAGQFDARCDVVTRDAGVRDDESGKPRARHELANLAHDINRLAERLQRNRQQSDEQVREATAVALQRMAEAEQAALVARALPGRGQPRPAPAAACDGPVHRRPAAHRQRDAAARRAAPAGGHRVHGRAARRPARDLAPRRAGADAGDHRRVAGDAVRPARRPACGARRRGARAAGLEGPRASRCAPMRRCCCASSATWSATRSATRSPDGTVLVAGAASAAARCASRCATTASASRRSTRRASSRSSTRSRTPSATAARASASASRSARASPRCWARASRCALPCRPAAPSR